MEMRGAHHPGEDTSKYQSSCDDTDEIQECGPAKEGQAVQACRRETHIKMLWLRLTYLLSQAWVLNCIKQRALM